MSVNWGSQKAKLPRVAQDAIQYSKVVRGKEKNMPEKAFARARAQYSIQRKECVRKLESTCTF